MISLFRVGEAVQAVCVGQGWRFCFVGGLALQRWGEPRVTEDVDLTLLTGFETKDASSTSFCGISRPGFPVPRSLPW